MILYIFLAGLAVYAVIITFFYKQAQKKLNDHQTRNLKLETLNTVLEEKLRFLEEQKKENTAKLKTFEEQIVLKFENLSQKIFQEKTEEFKKDSKEQISMLLDPLKDNIKTFQEKVEQYYGNESKERFSLRNEIQRIAEVGGQMQEETKQLTTALKGDSQSQGAWGEMILNRILEASGLRENEEYIVQGKDMQLRSSEGGVQKPDAIVLLPQNRHLVIDSKVSLTHYLKWLKEDHLEEKSSLLKSFTHSIRKHISDLHEKKYQQNDGIHSLDFVFMFFPMESAFALALQTDSAITDFAWKKSVLIVSPTTLLATLRTVAFMWQRQREEKNVIDIAKKAGALYDKFVGFCEDLKQVGQSLKKSQDNYEEAYKKLSTGKGNIVSRLETLKQLGARAEKSITNQDLTP